MALAAQPQTGAFASETYFVSPGAAVYRQAETPLLSAEGLTGIVGFSDGVSERWLHQLTSDPAPGVFQVLDRLASGDWDVARLGHYLEQPFWRLGGDDDRCVTFLVRSPC